MIYRKLWEFSEIKFFAIFRAQNKNIKQNFVEKKELSLNRRIFRSSNLAQTYFYRPRRGISVPLLKITPSPPTLHTSCFVPLCPLTTFTYRVYFEIIILLIFIIVKNIFFTKKFFDLIFFSSNSYHEIVGSL